MAVVTVVFQTTAVISELFNLWGNRNIVICALTAEVIKILLTAGLAEVGYSLEANNIQVGLLIAKIEK